MRPEIRLETEEYIIVPGTLQASCHVSRARPNFVMELHVYDRDKIIAKEEISGKENDGVYIGDVNSAINLTTQLQNSVTFECKVIWMNHKKNETITKSRETRIYRRCKILHTLSLWRMFLYANILKDAVYGSF